MRSEKVAPGFICLLVLLASSASAQIRGQVVASGLSQPVALIPDPAVASLFYVVEQTGLVRAFRNGSLEATPFIDLRGAISTGGERGLLGMAFAPDTASGRVFFNFTNPAGHTVVARFTRDLSASPAQANPASRFDLLWPGGERFIRQPFANHNGGQLLFGPDGYLYIGMGDGGSANDPSNNAQNPSTLLGKMLRIDVSVGDGDPLGYRIPPDNPFVDGQPIAALPEIWAFGLRNPWRYSFDDAGPGATGALIVGDVGQGAREEVNYEPRGAGGRNYGWRLREGRIATPGVPATPAAYGPVMEPLFDYPRNIGQAVTGGYVYRGAELGPAYHGRYFVADYVTSRVFSVGLAVHPSGEAVVTDAVEHTQELGGSLGGVASFGRMGGELYLLTFTGRIVKIAAAHASPSQPPQNLSASVSGSTVVVSWSPPAGSAAPAGYQLEAGSAPGLANLAVFAAPSNPTTLTFPNVPSGTYFVRVRSLGGGAASAPSNEIVVTVP
jgi:glucose/arabinose dehydrogenase